MDFAMCFVCVVVLVILFHGDPSLMDALIQNLMSNSK